MATRTRISHLLADRSLYRRSLRLSLDWAVNRQLWRGQALYIRSLFEKNRDVHDPRQLRVRSAAHTIRESAIANQLL